MIKKVTKPPPMAGKDVHRSSLQTLAGLFYLVSVAPILFFFASTPKRTPPTIELHASTNSTQKFKLLLTCRLPQASNMEI